MKKYILIITGLFLVGCGDTYWGYNTVDEPVNFNGVELAKGECTKLKDGWSSDFPFKAGPSDTEYGEDKPDHYAWNGEAAVKVTEAEAKKVCEKVEQTPEEKAAAEKAAAEKAAADAAAAAEKAAADAAAAAEKAAAGTAAEKAAAEKAAADAAAAAEKAAAAAAAAARYKCTYTQLVHEEIICKDTNDAKTLELRYIVYDTTVEGACDVAEAILQQYVPETKEICRGTEAECQSKRTELINQQNAIKGVTCSAQQS